MCVRVGPGAGVCMCARANALGWESSLTACPQYTFVYNKDGANVVAYSLHAQPIDAFPYYCPGARRHGEKCQSFRGKLANVTIERVSTKKSKKKWRRPTHSFLHLNLKSLVCQAHERSCKLMSFRLGFLFGDQTGPLYDEKLPNSYSPIVFSSLLKHLSSDIVKGCSSSS